VRRQQPHQALQHARARAKTEEFKTLYAQRAGVEGTISEASAGDGTAALSLHRSRKDASSTSGDGCCHEYRSFDALARWGTSCSDEAFPTDSAPPTGCLKYSQGSPAVSISVKQRGMPPRGREEDESAFSYNSIHFGRLLKEVVITPKQAKRSTTGVTLIKDYSRKNL